MSKLNIVQAIDDMFSKMSKEEVFAYLDSVGLKYEKLSSISEPHLHHRTRATRFRRYRKLRGARAYQVKPIKTEKCAEEKKHEL